MRAHRLTSLFLIGIVISLSAQTTSRPVSGQQIMDYIHRMADDSQLGRKPMTPEFLSLQDWARDKFLSWGLAPGGENGTFFQEVPIAGRRGTYSINLGIPVLKIDGHSFDNRYGDFTLSPVSTPKSTVKGVVLFAGYGIYAPEKGLDEYSDMDVSGKIVLVFKGSPNSAKKPRSMFGGGTANMDTTENDIWQVESSDSMKIAVAYEKGAKGIIFYDLSEKNSNSRQSTLNPMHFGHNFIIMSRISDNIFKTLMWDDPQESQRGFDRRIENLRYAIKQKTPRSRMLKHKIEIKGFSSTTFYGAPRFRGTCRNTIAMIPGSDPELKDEIIVIGAHFDHLGIRNGQIYNGADDNASGSAVVMEVAHKLSLRDTPPKRTILFCLWTGEELGLIGSSFWADNPTQNFKMDKVITYFNLDMVGLGDKIGAPGALNFPSIWKIITAGQAQDIMDVLEPATGGPGGSDHSAFIKRGIESMALMTRGSTGHPDYHDTGDDTEKLNPEILEKTAAFAYQGIINLSNAQHTLIIPDRQTKYDACRWTLTSIRPDVKLQRGWSIVEAQNDSQLSTLFVESIAKLKNPNNNNSSRRFRRRQDGSINIGVTSAACQGNANSAILAKALLNAGRFDIDGDDPFWFDADTLTNNGRSALHTLEDSDILIHLSRPNPITLLSVLCEAQLPLLISQADSIPDNAVKLIQDKKVLIAVELDITNTEKTINGIHSLIDRIGAERVVFDIVNIDKWDDTKTDIYQQLLSSGLSADDIKAMSGKGSSWRSQGRFDIFR
ncbi:M28 family peptidase [bacterium]|nr:M28 family peptidase [bacterium]